MFTKQEILDFIQESRQAAERTAKNLQYISSKRLNKALDIIEELLQERDSNE